MKGTTIIEQIFFGDIFNQLYLHLIIVFFLVFLIKRDVIYLVGLIFSC